MKSEVIINIKLYQRKFMNRGYIGMKEITHKDYLEFINDKNEVIIEDVRIKLKKDWNIKSYTPPEDYSPERTTIWSFPNRGSWATHTGNYRGNWSPYIPRNLILKYTQKGDWVLDQMMGSGTTLVEAKLLERNAIGVDINLDAVMLARDLSQLPLEEYLKEMKKVAEEASRVLKPGKVCAILIGDTRKHKHYIPIAFRVMQAFLEAGFILKEDIIKLQWNMKTTRERWRAKEYELSEMADKRRR